jgi:hypothetical protein
MEITVTIEDELSAQLMAVAQAAGMDVNEWVKSLMRDALSGHSPASPPVVPTPFTQRTFDLGWIPGMTWERMKEIAEEEDLEAFRRVESQKP